MTAPRTVPGQRCNIGPDEIARRRRFAIVASVGTVAFAVGLLAAGVPPVARAIVWPLAAAAAVTWLQVVRRFCVRFGAMGVENFGRLGGETEVDRRIRAADARRAVEMVLQGVLIGLLVTVALIQLPA